MKTHTMYSNERLGLIVVIVLILLTVWLMGCNTINGIGCDLTAVSKPYIVDKE